jgi:type IV pilus assembly protein PilV
MTMKPSPRSSGGSALLEVLVTIVILAFGLLGVAGLQSMIYIMEFESYQRAQAVVILNDIADRVAFNREAAATYEAASPLGGSGALANCSALSDSARDACEISNVLKGSGEQRGSAVVGAMNAAQACITTFTETSTKAFNHCQTGVQIDIVWRGRSPTIVPAASCGTTGGSPAFSATDAYRRAISTRVSTGDVAC